MKTGRQGLAGKGTSLALNHLWDKRTTSKSFFYYVFIILLSLPGLYRVCVYPYAANPEYHFVRPR